nr:hypothetical protein [Tanacetum cinerariifolium]
MDLFILIRAPNPTKVRTGSHPRAPHEVPLLTLTSARVIEMDEPAAATDSSGVPSAIEKSPLDFAHEDGASDQGTTAPEAPPPEDVPATAAPEVGPSEAAVAADPLVAQESRKRGHDGIDATAPPKSLRRDHAGLRPSVTLIRYLLLMLRHTIRLPLPSVAAAGDPESENVSSPAEVGSPGSVYRPKWGITNGSLLDTPETCQDWWIMLLFRVARRDQRIQARESEIKNLEALLETEASMKRAAEENSAGLSQELERMRRRWVIGYGLRLALMKCAKSLEMRQAFADVVSAGVAKDAKAKFAATLQSLKDLKYPLLDQLEGVKDAPVDLAIPMYLEVRDPRNPWAYKEEIKLSDAIAANISRAEKKKKCRIVCRTHGVGSAHHARSDGVPVSVHTVVPQGLALLLVDAATQTDLEDA